MDDCPFCARVRDRSDVSGSGDAAAVLVDRFPVSDGHVRIVPRCHNRALQFDSEDAFMQALLAGIPPAPADQAAIVEANRAGRPLTAAV